MQERTADDTYAPPRRSSRRTGPTPPATSTRRPPRSTAVVPVWAAAAIGIAALGGGMGIGIAITPGQVETPVAAVPPAVGWLLPTTPSGAPAPTPMQLGETLVLGPADDNGIAFTATRVADPATAVHIGPAAGTRYVAVELTITNKTAKTWDGSGVPTIGSVLIGTDGRRYGPILASTSLAPAFTAHVVITPGGIAAGAVTFQVPSDAKLTSVQIALTTDASVIGLWNLS